MSSLSRGSPSEEGSGRTSRKGVAWETPAEREFGSGIGRCSGSKG